MGFQNSSLQPVDGRIDGPGIGVSPWGNAYSSVLQALTYKINDLGNFQAYLHTTNYENQILLFLQDYPLAFQLFSWLGPGNYQGSFVGDATQGLQGSTGYNTVYTPSKQPLAEREQAQGVTLTHGVKVAGYPLLGWFRGDPAVMTVNAWTSSPQMSGYSPTTDVPVSGGVKVIQPTILRESDYTQAIADAGNYFEPPTDFPGFSYGAWVVGIFTETAA